MYVFLFQCTTVRKKVYKQKWDTGKYGIRSSVAVKQSVCSHSKHLQSVGGEVSELQNKHRLITIEK